MKKQKSISIKEIAKLSNVSVATVSRVINDNGRFSQETKERVEKVIKEHNYTTNMAARSLRSSKSKTVGLILPNIDNEWFSLLALEIEKYFFDHKYSVFICNTSRDDKKEIEYFRSLDSKLVDGIICISGIEKIPTNVVTRDIPIVCIDRKPIDHIDAYYVESNHYSGGYMATEELIKQGCKDIAIISRKRTLSVNRQRCEGYRQALLDHHLKIDPELEIFINEDEGSNTEGAKDAIKKLVKSGKKFDGVFATNDWRAYGVIQGLFSLNIKVPEQVKVVGFDDIFISKMSNPSISTIKQDIPGLSQKACGLLLDLMNGIEISDDKRHTILPVTFIPRESTKKSTD
ncbi:MAG: LacI family DNA-binding transcriptional regulator [Thomasclavelia sp.]|jgi:LacI family transcriptional regulator|nr:LacI family DNA-binding transcriptional regulator [Thomasclavelia sp.]